MSIPIIEAIYTSGATLYAIRRNRLNGYVWNTSTLAFEAYTASHWSQYAIALTEQTGSGYYSAAAPSTSGYLTSDAIYLQAGSSAAVTDTALILKNSVGENIAGISGDAAVSPSNLQAALSSETQGAVAAGTIAANSFTTNLTNANANAYQGMTLRFFTGVCAGMVGLIQSYSVSGGVITLSASLAATPSAGDSFIIA